MRHVATEPVYYQDVPISVTKQVRYLRVILSKQLSYCSNQGDYWDGEAVPLSNISRICHHLLYNLKFDMVLRQVRLAVCRAHLGECGTHILTQNPTDGN